MCMKAGTEGWEQARSRGYELLIAFEAIGKHTFKLGPQDSLGEVCTCRDSLPILQDWALGMW